jgi:hypothetical protein
MVAARRRGQCAQRGGTLPALNSLDVVLAFQRDPVCAVGSPCAFASGLGGEDDSAVRQLAISPPSHAGEKRLE